MIINKINRNQDSYRINRDILKSYEFDQGRSPVSLSNSSFNNSLSSILPSVTIETPSPAATFNITQRPAATATLLIDTPRNLSQRELQVPLMKLLIICWKRQSTTALEVILLVKYEKKLNNHRTKTETTPRKF